MACRREDEGFEGSMVSETRWICIPQLGLELGWLG